ncbi:MAG: fibronectin type III domain-containing protein, partial [Spirochaetota bacterium]
SLSSWDLPPAAKRENMFSGSKVVETPDKLPEVGGEKITVLAKPTGLAAGKVQATAMTITWTKVTDATAYRLYYSARSGFSLGDTGVKAVDSTEPKASVSGLRPKTGYHFKVMAVGNPAKNWNSPPSDKLSQNTPSLGKLATPTLKTPSDTDRLHNAITLNWGAVANASSYTLYYSKTQGDLNDLSTGFDGAASAAKGRLLLSGTSHRLGGLSVATGYHFKIVATATGWDDSDAGSTSASTRLPTPTNFRASPATGKAHEDITLSWTAVTGASTYTVYYSKNASDLNDLGSFTAGSDAKAKGNEENITTATKTIESLAIDTGYYFKLVAHESTPSEATNSLPAAAGSKTTKIQVANKAKLIEEILKAYTGYGTVAQENTDSTDDTKTGATASLNHIDTSQVTDMSYLFKGKEHFNGDITDWHTNQRQ